MKKMNWGWITYHKGYTKEDGSKYYIAELKAENDFYGYTKIKLPFFAKNVIKVLNWLCKEPRTKEEILNLSYKLILIK